MAEKQFIPNDPEQIISDTVAFYERTTGFKLNPADAERMVLDCMAYREMILRADMEQLMRQNFVQHASGTGLDKWAELFGIARLNGEDDEALRSRILASTRGKIGTTEAYRQRILLVPGVSDICLIRKCDDDTLPPGVVRLIPIMTHQTEGQEAVGAIHNKELETAILDSINAVDFGIICANFTFTQAVPTPISGVISVRGIVNYPAEQLAKNVNQKIDSYFNRLSRSFTSVFGVYDLEREILAADGVLTGGVKLSFVNVPILRRGEFYTKGVITVNFE